MAAGKLSDTRAARPATGASVADRLLAFAAELQQAETAQEGGRFTDIAEADTLVQNDANAFLLGALFAQGIPAEKAWAGPYLLKQRIGHLDPATIAAMPFGKLSAAFSRKPALHRFKMQMARYVQSAATKLVDEYGGDASNIWTGDPTAVELQRRLIAFDGIGQKKAAMMTEILLRHFRVRVRALAGTEVASDVHVRRVMWRTGLAPSDEARAVVESAAAIHPEHPGLLDLASWLIGRHWCRPAAPDCSSCRLAGLCPRVGVVKR